MKVEELGGFSLDVTEAVLLGMIFHRLLVARPLGSTGLGIRTHRFQFQHGRFSSSGTCDKQRSFPKAAG